MFGIYNQIRKNLANPIVENIRIKIENKIEFEISYILKYSSAVRVPPRRDELQPTIVGPAEAGKRNCQTIILCYATCARQGIGIRGGVYDSRR